MKKLQFKEIGCFLGLSMKRSHTVVDQWPLKLKAGSNQSIDWKDLEILLASSHSGTERYVEWRKD